MAIGVTLAGYVWRNGSLFAYSHGTLDVIAFFAFIAVLCWLLGPSRRDGLLGSDAHEKPGDSFAFLLGKKLRGVFRGLRSRA